MVVVGVGTMGPWCKEGKEWLNKLGQKIVETTEDVKATHFLMQRTSMVSYWANSVYVIASMTADECLDNIFIFKFTLVFVAV